jgi:hypothetical protein
VGEGDGKKSSAGEHPHPTGARLYCYTRAKIKKLKTKHNKLFSTHKTMSSEFKSLQWWATNEG